MSHYSELKDGAVFSRELAVTPELMSAFRSISGDDNRLHTDDSFARSLGFQGRVAYGNLIALLISSVIGVEMKHMNAMLVSETITFRKPVYCGDVVTLRAKVAARLDAAEAAELKYRVENQLPDLVASGTIQVKFL